MSLLENLQKGQDALGLPEQTSSQILPKGLNSVKFTVDTPMEGGQNTSENPNQVNDPKGPNENNGDQTNLNGNEQENTNLGNENPKQLITIDGAEYTTNNFGKNSALVYSKPRGTTGIDYYLPDGSNKPKLVANFDVEDGTFKSGIRLSDDFKGQSIGKEMFNDAFNKLGGQDKVNIILGDWAQGLSIFAI